MEKKWQIKKNPFGKEKISPETLVKVLLWNRGIKGEKQIENFLLPPPPEKISLEEVGISRKEVEKAKKRLKEAKKKGEKILVYGDYDADGLSGTALVWEGLYLAGFKAIPYIPDRIKDGYGLNLSRVEALGKKFPGLKLVITVDNGIVAYEAVEALKKKGIEVIVIDHHLKGKKKLKAKAIIHTTCLSASGVAWFFLKELGDLGVGFPDLGLAVLGAIADLLPLKGPNRSLVKYGMSFLEKTRRVGLRHLFRNAGIENKPLDSFKVSYIIAPRLNALGRIANSLDGLRLLCVRRLDKGEQLARLAHQVNSERQRITNGSFLLAKEAVLKKKKIPLVVFAASEKFHQGIVGLIAGKLAEEFYRPAFVIRKEKKVSLGSARSIPGFNIVEALGEARDILLEMGGHPMAAGFKVATKDINKLEKRLLSLAKKKLGKKKLVPKIEIDASLPLRAVNFDYYRAVSQLAPFGFGNPQPLFLFKNLRVVEVRQIGSDGAHLKLLLDDPQTPIQERVMAEAVGFNLGEWGGRLLPGDLVDVVASFDEDSWGGRKKIVLKIKDLRIASQVVK
ncbi:single-stranded-DNA-specific exonuclease RecJ [bacterium]|nr:single-stranded-DNA-specific exonuclease RecJ [bacterium]